MFLKRKWRDFGFHEIDYFEYIRDGWRRSPCRLSPHRGLNNIGHENLMLVQYKSSDDPKIIAPTTKWGKGFSLVRPTLDSLPLIFYPKRKALVYSPAFFPDSIHAKVGALSPDIIHLHWIASGFLRLETHRYFNRPLVWTLHDSWAFTGGCHIPFDCTRYKEHSGRCPALASKSEHDLSNWIWWRKRKAWKDLRFTVVTPSRWLANCARASSLFRDIRIEVIPNGINVSLFKPVDKECRIQNHPMTEEEMRNLANSRWVTICAHTVTCTPLSTLPEEAQRDEILSSKRHLEALLGTKITVFSYPFGVREDYNKISVRICREAGFIKAASNFPGQASRWTDPYQPPRQLVRNWDSDTFAGKMKRFWV